MQKNGEICLKINRKQSAKLKICSINFQNFFKQLSLVNFDTRCNLEKIHINGRDKNTSYNEKHHNHVPSTFAYKLLCIDDKFIKSVILY